MRLSRARNRWHISSSVCYASGGSGLALHPEKMKDSALRALWTASLAAIWPLAAPAAAQDLPTGQTLTPLAAPGARFEPLTARTGPHPETVADGAAAVALSPKLLT